MRGTRPSQLTLLGSVHTRSDGHHLHVLVVVPLNNCVALKDKVVFISFAVIDAAAIHRVKASIYKSAMRKSSFAFLKLSYRVYFLFLTAVRCFITLGMRVRDASHLD